ncbi:glycosyltransferase family 9 protein [Kaistia nematophila]|uniref:Lipopolysaccharide heptosyltransferase family protein n=1 Tax=Kaistia nematophila TaxID=2994654 RepID=A0A9X3DXZ9_9HYPH|nr:glycosyltransferase family 9 protein [Kaistia nematophila]MCX5567734.1 lipopolysaccharide heptosyltransferase family protein [Kaistia nematophila]
MNQTVGDQASRPIAVIVEREGLGDVILKLPLLRAIRHARPDREIWWISAHDTAMQTAVLPYVEGGIARVMAELDFTEPLLQGMRTLKTLPPFSAVFDTRTRVASVLAARLVLRYDEYYACLPGLNRRVGAPWWDRRRPKHIGERALGLARQALGNVDASGRIAASAGAEAVAATLLPPVESWIGFAFGSNKTWKNWPLERFVALARELRQQGYRPVLLAGPDERAALPVLAETAPDVDVVDMTAMKIDAPRGKLDAPLALAPSLKLLVANDCGLGHLFGAAGVPVVSLFGPTKAERWAPNAPASRIVSAQDFGGEAMTDIPLAPVVAATLDFARELGVRPAG